VNVGQLVVHHWVSAIRRMNQEVARRNVRPLASENELWTGIPCVPTGCNDLPGLTNMLRGSPECFASISGMSRFANAA
jgi:hypothetical protein